MATCSSILAWRIPWTEEPGRLQSMGLQIESDTIETTVHTHILFPLCLSVTQSSLPATLVLMAQRRALICS